MRIEVNITKKKFFVILIAIFVLAAGFAVYAYNAGSNYASPSTSAAAGYKPATEAAKFGHTSDETNVNIGGQVMTLQDAINRGLLSNGSNLPIHPGHLHSYRFVTKYTTLMSNETFRAWLAPTGGGAGWPTNGGDDHGWYIRSTSNAKFKDTVKKLCEYFMGVDSFPNFYSGVECRDYESDNNNRAYYWDSASNSWKIEDHGDNGCIDITSISCVSEGGILPRALPFI